MRNPSPTTSDWRDRASGRVLVVAAATLALIVTASALLARGTEALEPTVAKANAHVRN